MSKVKTAVSLSQEVLSNADRLAESLSTSRSQVFEMALLEFVERHQNQQMLEQLNDVYSEELTTEEIQLTRRMKSVYKSAIEEW